MKLGIMQPYLFPYLGYWQLINAVDLFVIFDDVNYINRGWINKNQLLINYQAWMFTLPLRHSSPNRRINEIELFSNDKWSIDFLKTIERAYKKAPEYELVYPVLEDIIITEEKNLAKYLGRSLRKIANYLGMKTEFIYSSDVEKNNNYSGENKILDIAKSLHATEYINAIGGLELYDKDRFSKEKIELKFLQSELIEYKQYKNNFVSNLSIIDIMMFNEKNKIHKFLDQYNLL